MACSIEGIKPEFVPPFLCSDTYCDQLADFLVNESSLDELWRSQGFPTPPSTPERVYTPNSNLNTDLDTDSESDNGQEMPLLNELVLLAYGEEIMASNPSAFPPVSMTTDDEGPNLQDKLIQDCMWSGGHCEKTNKKPPPLSSSSLSPSLGAGKIADSEGSTYTPAPSPPPTAPVVVGGDSSHDDEGMESDCISPSAVFPSLLTPPASATIKLLSGVGTKVDQPASAVAMETETSSTASLLSTATTSPVKKVQLVAPPQRSKPPDDPDWDEWAESGSRGYERNQRRNKRKLSTMAVGTGANNRHQPQSESSTSDEEIDVVTVTSADRTKVPRKRCHSSLSAPCSRQGSPNPVPKRRKYHTKRLQRLGSAGSAAGENVDSEDEARRASHNVLERKRRNDLKSSFQRLREEIPELEDNQRAPKVTILKKAMEYIRRMQEIEREEEAELIAERKRKAELMARLNKLRSAGNTN